MAFPLMFMLSVSSSGKFTRTSFLFLVTSIFIYKDLTKVEYPMALEKEDAILMGNRPIIPSDCPAEYAGLMKSCWAAEPATRPTFSSITSVFLMRIITKLDPELMEAINKADASAFQ